MKKAVLAFLLVSFTGAITTVPAFAESVLYDNTTVGSNTSGGFGMSSGGGQISDSFTLTSSATVTGADFNVWLSTYPYTGIGDSLTSINWSIGTSALDSSLGSGTDVAPASFTTLTTGTHLYYDTAEEWITIPEITLAAGTYWFTLSDAVSSNSDPVYWDYSFGPSNANSNLYGEVGSETFQILGDNSSSATPEPSSFLLLGSGLMGLAGVIRSKLKDKSTF